MSSTSIIPASLRAELEAIAREAALEAVRRHLPAAEGPLADDVAAFLATRPPRERVAARALYEAFLAWAEGVGAQPRTGTAFGRALALNGSYRRVRRSECIYWER